MRKSSIRYIILLGAMALTLVFCSQEPENNPQAIPTQYLNLDPKVDYVGMETCKTCHADIHSTFIHTGMGRSFDHATRQKSAATYKVHDVVYDENSNFYYKPYFQDSSLYIKEFRLGPSGDTVHQRTEKITYIVGSGQHTNSHILSHNGYIFQAPITYYTQEGRWDMAPGFRGENLRFSRLLAAECITCHNHLPDQVQGSMNKYVDMPRGIECERCHGPGELHVAQKSAGEIVDTSKYIDYSIVNPSDLPRDLQMDLCQRCHLQGVAVLKEDQSFYDFRPGMRLNKVMNVFLPRYTNSHEKFIMASQADRLRMSPCYMESEELSCLTCHNPHKSIEVTSVNQYNRACEGCHASKAGEEACSYSPAERLAVDNNCVSCHMPPSGSVDIPHVNITDHYISRQTAQRGQAIAPEQEEAIARFLGLEMLTSEEAQPLEMAQGYIALYDKYVAAAPMLDSAYAYLEASTAPMAAQLKTRIHYHFARLAYPAIVELVAGRSPSDIKEGWTAYRIGEAYYQLRQLPQALSYYQRATEFMPFHLDFQEKLATAYAELGQLEPAIRTLEFVLKENPKRKVALCNLGFFYVSQGRYKEGEALYDRAIALDPDYVQALLNKGAILLFQQKNSEAKTYLERVLALNPEHAQARMALGQIQ
ncbi:MAG: tetratricopeptide repeat protein [Bacteroidota bacterium]